MYDFFVDYIQLVQMNDTAEVSFKLESHDKFVCCAN